MSIKLGTASNSQRFIQPPPALYSHVGCIGRLLFFNSQAETIKQKKKLFKPTTGAQSNFERISSWR